MNKENNIHKNHRERMRNVFLSHGFDAFSDIEKLEFILYFTIAQKDTNPIAHNLLNEFGSFDRVLEADIDDLCKVDGMGKQSAILLHLIMDIISSYGRSKADKTIPGTESAMQYAKNIFMGKTVEEFYVVCLTSANKVIATKMINSGTVSEVPVMIRDITSIALSKNCERIILMHNHPVGLEQPSDEDLTFTIRILVSCFINNIEVLDHIIVGGNKQAFSFQQNGLLKSLKENAMSRIDMTKNSFKFSSISSNYVVNK